jgi:hypothetical protein
MISYTASHLFACQETCRWYLYSRIKEKKPHSELFFCVKEKSNKEREKVKKKSSRGKMNE